MDSGGNNSSLNEDGHWWQGVSSNHASARDLEPWAEKEDAPRSTESVRKSAQSYISAMPDIQERLMDTQEAERRLSREPSPHNTLTGLKTTPPRSAEDMAFSSRDPRDENAMRERLAALQMSARRNMQRVRMQSAEADELYARLERSSPDVNSAVASSHSPGVSYEGLTNSEMRVLLKQRDDEGAAKDTLIAELTRELARVRRTAKGSEEDGIEEMAFEIEALLTRQVELEEELLRSERKLQDVIRSRAATSSPMDKGDKSSAARRRTRALEAQVDASMNMEQRLRAENAILANENRKLQRQCLGREGQAEKKFRQQNNALRKAQGIVMGLTDRLDQATSDRQVWEKSYKTLTESSSLRIKELTDTVRNLSAENSRLQKVIAALQVAVTSLERDRNAMQLVGKPPQGDSSLRSTRQPQHTFDQGIPHANVVPFSSATSLDSVGPTYSETHNGARSPSQHGTPYTSTTSATHNQNGYSQNGGLHEQNTPRSPPHLPSTALPAIDPSPFSQLPINPATFPPPFEMRPASPSSPSTPAYNRPPSPSLSPPSTTPANSSSRAQYALYRDRDPLDGIDMEDVSSEPYEPPPRPEPYEMRVGRSGATPQQQRELEPYALPSYGLQRQHTKQVHLYRRNVGVKISGNGRHDSREGYARDVNEHVGSAQRYEYSLGEKSDIVHSDELQRLKHENNSLLEQERARHHDFKRRVQVLVGHGATF